jgi:glyoxylase-like metal-dependent hydrolase (beta-lactamase superfamily II)
MKGIISPMTKIHTLDLKLRGSSNALAAHVIKTEQGSILVDCGPETTLQNLYLELERVGVHNLKYLLLTHIHLDHAGAAGRLARELDLTVFVHARGAKHLIDPTRLLASATKIFGNRMQEIWGNIEPVTNLEVLNGGELLELCNLEIQALYTPGHAVHHLAFQMGDSIFAGDVAGVRIGQHLPVPPTPPPDINLEQWRASIALLQSRTAKMLYIAHFGRFDDAPLHLEMLLENLELFAQISLSGLQTGESSDEIAAQLRNAIGRLESDEFAGGYVPASISASDVAGLERYWRTVHPELL